MFVAAADVEYKTNLLCKKLLTGDMKLECLRVLKRALTPE